MDRRNWTIAEAIQKERLAWAERERLARPTARVTHRSSRRGRLLGLALYSSAMRLFKICPLTSESFISLTHKNRRRSVR